MVTVGQRVYETRLARGLSQRELADLCGPGVTHAHVSRIESGARTASVKALRKIARVLNVTPEWLEFGVDPPDVERARRALLVGQRYAAWPVASGLVDDVRVVYATERAAKFLLRALVALDPTTDSGKVTG